VLPLFDPPRDDAKATVAEAVKMGVKIKMVTGDALAIAKETAKKLDMGTNILDAASLGDSKKQETAEVAESIEKADGFAQVFPEHKYHIIDVLQKRGHIVGMTGDGVNDSPALKKADCGIAVSGATDAARAAASIVLVAPGLSVIIDAIKESRKIFQRMNSYAIYRIAETLRVLFFMTLSILVFRFYPVTAVMIVMIALLNDGAILSIAYDNVHYRNKPEAWNMRMVLGISTVLGVIGVVAAFGLFYLGEKNLLSSFLPRLDRAHIQTLMYLKLSVAGHLTIFLTRTRGPFWSIPPAKILWGAVLGTQTVATLIAVFGIFMAPISWKWAAFVWIYALAWALVNDRVKLVAYWILDRTEAGATPEARAQHKIEAKVEPKPESKPEPKSASPPESKAGSKAAPKPDAKPEVKAEAADEPESESKPETGTAPKAKAGAESKPSTEPQPEAKVEAKPESKPKTTPDLTPQIATRAYELYEQQGHRDGQAVQNWNKAEREIRKDQAGRREVNANAEPMKPAAGREDVQVVEDVGAVQISKAEAKNELLKNEDRKSISGKDFRVERPLMKLASRRSLHYASSRYALLLIFQGMDAAGKDGAIRHVMSGVNPQGCEVFSFKQPSAEELKHDFLWRTTRRLPERGRIGIFNRSYYEEVLVVRVHPEILRGQGLPEELLDEKTIWEERYRSIVDLEAHLHRNGTRIVKFFLHLSKDEQRKRFLERIDEPDKNWKFSLADIHERKYWKQYMEAYEACLNATSTHHAPWYVVPADDKENARLIVSQILLDAFKELKMAYPKTKRSARPSMEHQ
jgi:PPK2 family polyphosphate:nucleotide phosphotransferase